MDLGIPDCIRQLYRNVHEPKFNCKWVMKQDNTPKNKQAYKEIVKAEEMLHLEWPNVIHYKCCGMT